MRSKENDYDYRYFPDPDLLPLVLDPTWVAGLRAELPELPDAKRARFVTDYGLTADEAEVLVAERATAEFFEDVARGRDPKAAANWVTGDLFAALNRKGLGIEESPVGAAALGRLVDLIADGTISGRIAKEIFAEMVETGGDPAAIVEAKGLRQVTDTGAIEAAVDAALAATPLRRAIRDKPEAPRLLRRSGDEGDPGQSQPHPRQRAAEEEARRLTIVSLPGSAGRRRAGCGNARRSPCRNRRRIRRGCRSPCSGSPPAGRRRCACG